MTMHLERILQSQGLGTRKGCRALIRDGRVSVAGEVCENPFAEFVPQGCAFTVDGEAWSYREKAYVLLNKPAGYECSRAPRHHRGIFALLPEAMSERGVQPIGRLDEDTTGLLLLTDDGQFIHAVSSAKRKVPKVYEAVVKHPLDEAMMAALLQGVVLHDAPEPAVAVACERVEERLLRLTVSEGRYHQVKRMVAAAGNRVEQLRRVAVGALELPPDLPEGQWRWLEAEDLEGLWSFEKLAVPG